MIEVQRKPKEKVLIIKTFDIHLNLMKTHYIRISDDSEEEQGRPKTYSKDILRAVDYTTKKKSFMAYP